MRGWFSDPFSLARRYTQWNYSTREHAPNHHTSRIPMCTPAPIELNRGNNTTGDTEYNMEASHLRREFHSELSAFINNLDEPSARISSKT